jgi:polyphosphate kinase
MYTNRDVSWLEFDERIIQQVTMDIPLMEKLNMLSISASNLDEFIMVRISKLLHNSSIDPYESDFDEIRYKDLLKYFEDKLKDFKTLQNEVYKYIKEELDKQNIFIKDFKDLKGDEIPKAKKLFGKKIEPLLVVNYLDTLSFINQIRSKKVYLLIQTANDMYYIEIPDYYSDIYKLNNNIYLRTEDLILSNLKQLFDNEHVKSYCAVRFLRSAHYDFPFCDESKMDEEVEEMLSCRESSPIISYEISDKKGDIENILSLLDNITYNDMFIYDIDGYLNISSLNKIKINDKSLYYSKRNPNTFDLGHSMNMLDAIDQEGTILLQHPYDSYDPIIKLVQDASKDKDVIMISQTLYRVSSIDSPIIEALCDASMKYRKKVNVIIELKARFDEGRNLQIRQKLYDAGCNVMYSKSSIKIHGKCLSVIKMDDDEIKYYTHIGTGNYNEKTSRLYVDMSYFTNNKKIGKDVFSLFKNLEIKNSRPTKLKKLILSPDSMRPFIIQNIKNETENAKKGLDAAIMMKVNSLSDERIIYELYEASKAGVDIKIIVRGICSMNKINDNIEIKSIIGRYLEHSRIYYFHNNGDETIAISSADILRRNLDRRIEILLPIKEKKIKKKIKKILSIYWADTTNSYHKLDDNSWIKDPVDKDSINCHEEFYNL